MKEKQIKTESENKKMVCPICGGTNVKKHSVVKSNGNPRGYCKDCKKAFVLKRKKQVDDEERKAVLEHLKHKSGTLKNLKSKNKSITIYRVRKILKERGYKGSRDYKVAMAKEAVKNRLDQEKQREEKRFEYANSHSPFLDKYKEKK